jgi:hypothetical protein
MDDWHGSSNSKLLSNKHEELCCYLVNPCTLKSGVRGLNFLLGEPQW